MRRLFVLLLVVALVPACGTGEPVTDSGESTNRAVVTGSPARLRDSLRSMRGRPAVVNFWATWCVPCEQEMPRLVAAARKYAKRIGFLGVNVEDDLGAARDFARRLRIPFRSLALSRDDVQRTQKILGLPVTQFYGPDGDLAFVHQGEIRSRELRDKIDELLRIGAKRPR